MIVRYTRRAIADVTAIADYITIRHPVAARDIEQAIRTSVSHLADHPRLGTDRPDLDARALGVPRYPYTIYYRIEGDVIAIVHIRDDRRQPLTSGDL